MFSFILYLNNGEGLPGAGQSNSKVSKAVEGQKGDLGIWGSGMSRRRSRNWITFDHLTVKTTPLGLNCASLAQRCLAGSKAARDWTSKLDFLKKEKKATRQADQKHRSKLFVKSNLSENANENVYGNREFLVYCITFYSLNTL